MDQSNVFIELLKTQLNRGIYVWGGDGEILDEMGSPLKWIWDKEIGSKDAEHEANAVRAQTLYKKRVEAGLSEIRAFDCSGLICWALKCMGLQSGDISSRGLYAKCAAKTDAAQLRAGDLVFRHDGEKIVHVGAYIGGGYCIECRGRDYGVVKTKSASRGWNRYGRFPGMYDADEPTAPASDAYVFARILKYGKRGTDVCELKKLLAAAGYDGLTPINQNYLSKTRSVVKAYQSAHGLAVDGVAGMNTITALGGKWGA